eukprot:GHVN01074806.1.p1 GENE.GHVN01074806.1~~GHVN01074806.1.p1  ORF type:complete len:313 (-),score=-4.53 GHVN01074806.1:322-1260(-)
MDLFAQMMINDYDEWFDTRDDWRDDTGEPLSLPEGVGQKRKYDTPIAADIRRYPNIEDQRPLGPTMVEKLMHFIGMLLWFFRCGRWDLAFAATSLCSRLNTWAGDAWLGLDRSMGYIRKYGNYVLRAQMHMSDTPNDLRQITYADCDLPRSGRPLSCYLTCLESDRGTFLPISFSTKAQALCCDSTTAAEWVAPCFATRDALRTRILLGDLFSRTKFNPPVLRVDNQPAISILRSGRSDSVSHMSYAVSIRLGFVKDLIYQDMLRVEYVRSAKNLADIGTKVLNATVLSSARQLNNIVAPTSAVCRGENEDH